MKKIKKTKRVLPDNASRPPLLLSSWHVGPAWFARLQAKAAPFGMTLSDPQIGDGIAGCLFCFRLRWESPLLRSGRDMLELGPKGESFIDAAVDIIRSLLEPALKAQPVKGEDIGCEYHTVADGVTTIVVDGTVALRVTTRSA